MVPPLKFCSDCGAPVVLRVPEGDNRLRAICLNCGTIHYQNPKIVVGCIPEWEDQILLCRRAIEPRYGLWTLPAGFMENGETAQAGAARETLEEARARVEVGALYACFSLSHVDQVYLLFRSQLLDLHFGPGSESLEVKLFKPTEIPWDEMAFFVIRETLEGYFKDRMTGQYPLRTGEIRRMSEDPQDYRITYL